MANLSRWRPRRWSRLLFLFILLIRARYWRKFHRIREFHDVSGFHLRPPMDICTMRCAISRLETASYYAASVSENSKQRPWYVHLRWSNFYFEYFGFYGSISAQNTSNITIVRKRKYKGKRERRERLDWMNTQIRGLKRLRKRELCDRQLKVFCAKLTLHHELCNQICWPLMIFVKFSSRFRMHISHFVLFRKHIILVALFHICMSMRIRGCGMDFKCWIYIRVYL